MPQKTCLQQPAPHAPVGCGKRPAGRQARVLMHLPEYVHPSELVAVGHVLEVLQECASLQLSRLCKHQADSCHV